MASLIFANGASAATIGAIVGDAPNPFCSTTLVPNAPNSMYLTSGSLSKGDGPELGGLSDATIEFWFQLSALPAAERILMQGPEVSAGNRQWGFTISTAGKVKFYVRGAGLYTTTGNVVLALNTWYHIVGAADSAATLVRLYVNAVQDTTAAYTSPIGVSSLAAGDAGSFMVGDANAEVTYGFDEIAVYRRLLATSRISAHYTAGAAMGLPLQKPGARMTGVLDRSISVHAPRSLQAGSRTVTETYFSGQAPLDDLLRADAAENVDAMLFVARDGTVTFLDAGHRSSAPYNTSQVTFGDAGGAEIAYQDAPMDYSEQFLVNEWNVSRRRGQTGIGSDVGETQTVSDATSISRYLKHSQSISDLPLISDSDAATIATALLAKFKDPVLRVNTLTGTCGDPGFAEAFFRREIGDRVTVKRTPPGGGARIINDFYIQSISIDGTPEVPWRASFGLSPL